MDRKQKLWRYIGIRHACFAAKWLAVLLLLLCTSCDTKNVRGTAMPTRGPQVTVTVPTGMMHGVYSTWSAAWTGGTAPYSIEWDFGGGAEPNVVEGLSVGNQIQVTLSMRGPSIFQHAIWTYSVRVTDASGLSDVESGTYTVGYLENQPPSIDSLSFDAATRTVIVVVSDPDGDDITVTLSTPDGILVAPDHAQVPAGGPGEVSFRLSAGDIFIGASETITVTADDGTGASDTETLTVGLSGLNLASDTLYAIPLKGTVEVSDGNRATDDAGVVVVIAAGVPANPFQYLNGAGLTVESAATFVSNTFNAGAPGGDAGAIDGFWTSMDPGHFLLPPDGFIVATDIGGGRERWDFNLTPVGGSDVTTSEGALFNCKFEFGAAGTYNFGFQEFDAVNRTYYQDSTNTQYFWGDISNEGVPNTVVVTAGDD